MPRFIGDIGGTSSRWALLPEQGQNAVPVRLPGYNPATGNPAAMQAALREAFSPDPEVSARVQVTAYGAGCGATIRSERLREVLLTVWPQAEVDVQTDLLGAARALYGRDAGLVLILGTGMNAGHYDGEHLHLPMPSLGHVLGDEGSGADIGKHLLRDVLHGHAPRKLAAVLFPDRPDLPAILEATYRSASPQAYLASFTGLLALHADEPYVQDLVASRFSAMARLLLHYFSPEERGQARACGSVAFGFQEVLRGVLAHEGIALNATAQDPLPGLLRFHAAALH